VRDSKYCATILRSELNLGSDRVASFCRAFPTEQDVDAITVTAIATHTELGPSIALAETHNNM
jgi:hypothetical protein